MTVDQWSVVPFVKDVNLSSFGHIEYVSIVKSTDGSRAKTQRAPLMMFRLLQYSCGSYEPQNRSSGVFFISLQHIGVW